MARFLISMVALLLIVPVVAVYDRRDQASVVLAQSEIKVGEKIYLENCVACHGQKGDGKGPEAGRLKTKPRDFTTGNYKFRSTPSGSLPPDNDIFRTVS